MQNQRLLSVFAVVAGISLSVSAFAEDENMLSGMFSASLKIVPLGNVTQVQYKPALINYPNTVDLTSEYSVDGTNYTPFDNPITGSNSSETFKTYIRTKSLAPTVTTASARVGANSSAPTMSIALSTNGQLDISALSVAEIHPSKANDDDSNPDNDKVLIPVSLTIKDGRATGDAYTYSFKYKNDNNAWAAATVGEVPTCGRGQALAYMNVIFINCSQVTNGSTEIALYRHGGGQTVQVGDAVTVDLSSICGGQSSSSSSPPEQCTDGIDNDDNGATDCSDSACYSDPACQESSSSYPSTENDCSDSVDNDNNGYTDCNDSACSSDPVCAQSSSSSSSESYSESNCSDAIDNDSNGYTDCADSACSGDYSCSGSSSSY